MADARLALAGCAFDVALALFRTRDRLEGRTGDTHEATRAVRVESQTRLRALADVPTAAQRRRSS